jgi:hypothetical protein
MQFFDTLNLGQAVEITGTRETRNGSLVVNARAARGGNVQDYLGVEVDRPDMPIVRVYRDADEIFHKDSLKTFGHKPVTLNHPPAPVTSRTWKDVARGHTGEEVLRDGEFVRIPMMVSDQAAIDAVKGGHRELSVGYQCDLDWTPGVSPSGQAYDARQVKIIVDHVAIVDRGRAGPDCRIGDEHPADAVKTMRALSTADRDPPSMHKLTIDGVTIDLSDTAREVVSKLQDAHAKALSDTQAAQAALNDAKTAHANAIQAKDGEIAALKAQHQSAIEAKDGEIAATKAMIPDAAKLDVLAAARADLIGKAKAILGDAFVAAGKPDAEIRKAVVSHALGDAAKDMTDAAIEGAFAVVSAGKVAVDPVRRVLSDARNVPITDAASAHREMLDRMSSAWKHSDAKGNA